ncbi:hypothetical protein GALMADRAFT_224281 [Galerina marginata CBS 339.88]|uniref:Auxin efflux carrier n=1 Tax=Galerina marginata (strain CBS 339.88) TaxID=685588 RepID=A0A067TJ97_GALM3|nr:hypothetical protein GALMADRAFT_224281 [Galerina marginata CBS 339.88]
MVSAGTLIWISCRPLLRLIFCVSCGIAITKADIFPAVAAAGAGQVLLNITLPCLMFSKIVPAFTSSNASALGPLILVAVLYEALGALLAYIVKLFFWVPHRFRYGVIVAGGWGNVGDIPTAVILSVTGAPPFQGVDDQNLSVAYISAFILVFMVTLFPFGGHKLVAWDFQGPDVEPEEVREAMKLKRKALFQPSLWSWNKGLKRQPESPEPMEAVSEKEDTGERQVIQRVHRKPVCFIRDSSTVVPIDGLASPVRSPSPTEINYRPRSHRLDSGSPQKHITMTDVNTPSDSRAVSQSVVLDVEQEILPTFTAHAHQNQANHSPALSRSPTWTTISEFIKAFLTPSSITILVSFPIALIPKLKALFVEVPGTYMPPAPDGQPPLAFILDATSFVGAASVPLGLVCLGSSLARLNIPRKGQWKNLPLGAITWIAIAKMVVMPVLGVLICEGLTNVGVISREDKVLRFVCIFFSCLPTATVHVLLTQVYSGTGSSEHLSPFLIPQYILMFISMTALTAYTIQLLY